MLWRATDHPRRQLVIAAHHPDRVRRPEPRIGAIERDRFVQALTWNVFRTLELLPPAFWLRRLHARLARQVPARAPQVVRVTLWPLLEVSAARALETGAGPVPVDVLIETEHAVWALLTGPIVQEPDAAALRGAVADVLDAARWRAGTRDCHIGAITLVPLSELPAMSHVARRDRAFPRLAAPQGHTPPAPAPALPLDVMRWTELADVLRDCADADVLTPIERALARNAVIWMEGVEGER